MSNIDTHTIVLASDGRFVSLGRASEPTDAEISAVSGALASAGLTAWLATMRGTPYGRRKPVLAMVKTLTGEGDFNAAVSAFFAANVR